MRDMVVNVKELIEREAADVFNSWNRISQRFVINMFTMKKF